MRVAIVGGGVMGCASALALRSRGVDVVLLERAIPGAEASSAAAGILGAQVESHVHDRELFDLFVRARREYGAWADMLRDASQIDIGHRVSGVLKIAKDESDAREIAKSVAWQREIGLRAEMLDARAARSIEPELAANVHGAAYFADDAQVDPPALLRALSIAATRAGVTVRSGATVRRVIIEQDACVGIELDDGILHADATVLAAGSWSSLVPGVPTSIPEVKPARGQMALLDERPPRVRTIVFGENTYVVPRGDGRVLCGSTLEFVGFRREVTAGGIRTIVNGALSLVPSLENASLVSTWSNFRPFTESERPMIGKSPVNRLYLATGHYRNGILLAKVTG